MGAYKYSAEQMDAAVDDYINGKESLPLVAKRHGIKYPAIYAYMRKHGKNNPIFAHKTPRVIVPKDKIDEAVAFATEVGSVTKAAKKFGLSRSVLAYHYEKAKEDADNPRIERAPRPMILPERRKEILDYYLADHSVQDTAERFGVAMSSVSRIVREFGHEVRGIGYSQKQSWLSGHRKPKPRKSADEKVNYRLSDTQKGEIVDYFMPHTILDTATKFCLPESVIHRVVSTCYSPFPARVHITNENEEIYKEAAIDYIRGMTVRDAAIKHGVKLGTLRKYIAKHGLQRSRSKYDYGTALDLIKNGATVEDAAKQAGIRYARLAQYLRENDDSLDCAFKRDRAPLCETAKGKEIAEYYSAGHSGKECVAKFHIGTQELRQCCLKHLGYESRSSMSVGGKKNGGYKFFEEDYQKALAEYQAGKSFNAAGAVAGMSGGALRLYMVRNGLEIRPSSQRQTVRASRPPRFSEIDQKRIAEYSVDHPLMATAAYFGTTVYIVKKYRKQFGIEEKANKLGRVSAFSEKDFKKAAKMYADGATLWKAADRVGMSESTLYNYLVKTGQLQSKVTQSTAVKKEPAANIVKVVTKPPQNARGFAPIFTHGEYEKAAKMYANGATIVEAANAVGISKSAFHRYVQKNGVIRKKK